MFMVAMNGTVAGFAQTQDGDWYIRVNPEETLTQVNEGERSGVVSFLWRKGNPLPEGLCPGAKVAVEGVGYLGLKAWQRTSDYGKAMGKVKTIENIRMEAHKITVAGKKAAAA